MPTASEIIERVKARYAGCRSYEDEGEVVLRLPGTRSVGKDAFRTAFARDSGIVFELTGRGVGPRIEQVGRGIAWVRRNDRRWRSIPTMELLSTRLDVVNALRDASVAAPALLVVALFAPELAEVASDLPTEAHVVRERLDSIECYVLDNIVKPSNARVWIDATTWLIRKHEQRFGQSPSEAEIITTWHPRMDHDIDPKVFEFVPPG